MRRGIVHIGMPRTGSTSLQTVLAGLRPRLAAVGVLYPDIAPRAFGPCPNHQPFGETFDGRRPPHERAECLEALSRALAGTDADTVILSYEDFAQQKPRFGVSGALREALARHGFAMEVAVVVKPPSEHLTSVYAHRAQMIQETRSFGGFARGFWRSGRFDYDALVAPWAAAAQGRLTAIPLRDRRADGPLTARVLDGLGLLERVAPLLGAEDSTRVENRSPGPVAVEVGRRLRGMRAHRQVRVHPREVGRFVDTLAWSRGLDRATFRGNDAEILARIDAHFAPACERLAQRAWGRSWAEVVAPAPARPANELAGRPLAPETQAAVDDLVRAACDQFGFVAPPAWRRVPADAAEAAAGRLARLVGYSRWRVA